MKAAEPVKNVLILGDSLAAGFGVEPEEAFPARLQEKIDRAGLPCRIINGGVSGDTSAGGLRRIDWLLKQPVDLLVLELGGNDGLRGIPPESTSTNLQAIIDKVREKNPKTKILIAGMMMPSNLGDDYTQKFKNVFGSIAERNHASLVPFLLEGVGGNAELNQPDRIHPTAAGHEIVAENVWKVLRPMLEK